MASRPHEPRSVAIPLDAGGQLALDGILAAGERGGAVVAPPHPLYGGSMSSPVVSEIAHACARAGLAALCFDWRGVGGSGGEPSGEPAAAEADYVAALRYLEAAVAGPIVACGYSWGAAAALRASGARERVERLLLVAPPPSLLDAAGLAAVSGGALVLAGEQDTLAPPAEIEKVSSGAERVELVVIPGADHFFAQGLGIAELGRASAEWLERTG